MVPVRDARKDHALEVREDTMKRLGRVRCLTWKRLPNIAGLDSSQHGESFRISQVVRDPINDPSPVRAEHLGMKVSLRRQHGWLEKIAWRDVRTILIDRHPDVADLPECFANAPNVLLGSHPQIPNDGCSLVEKATSLSQKVLQTFGRLHALLLVSPSRSRRLRACPA
jgi:hypothetical protein